MTSQAKPVYDSIPLDVTELTQEELLTFAEKLAMELNHLRIDVNRDTSLHGCFNTVGLGYHVDKGKVLLGEVMYRFGSTSSADVLAHYCSSHSVACTRSVVSFLAGSVDVEEATSEQSRNRADQDLHD